MLCIAGCCALEAHHDVVKDVLLVDYFYNRTSEFECHYLAWLGGGGKEEEKEEEEREEEEEEEEKKKRMGRKRK